MALRTCASTGPARGDYSCPRRSRCSGRRGHGGRGGRWLWCCSAHWREHSLLFFPHSLPLPILCPPSPPGLPPIVSLPFCLALAHSESSSSRVPPEGCRLLDFRWTIPRQAAAEVRGCLLAPERAQQVFQWPHCESELCITSMAPHTCPILPLDPHVSACPDVANKRGARLYEGNSFYMTTHACIVMKYPLPVATVHTCLDIVLYSIVYVCKHRLRLLTTCTLCMVHTCVHASTSDPPRKV